MTQRYMEQPRSLVVALVLVSALAGLGEATDSVELLVSSPILGKLVQEIGGENIRTHSVWAMDGPPACAEMSKDALESAGRARLFVRYGVEPFVKLEYCALSCLNAKARVVILADRLPPNKKSCGELALDPVWSYDAAGELVKDLSTLMPERKKSFEANLLQLRSELLKVTYGSSVGEEAKKNGLLEPGREKELNRYLATVEGAVDSLNRRIRNYSGAELEDTWGVLSAFNERFGIVNVGDIPVQDQYLNAPRILVNWSLSPTDMNPPTWRIIPLFLSPFILAQKADGKNLAASIVALMDLIEPAVIVGKVRDVTCTSRLLRLDSAVALQFDRRAVEESLRILNSETSPGRRRAAMLLGYIGDSRAVEPLIDLMTTHYAHMKVSGRTWSFILACTRPMGLLAESNDEAFHFLEKGCSPSFWNEQITLEVERAPRQGVILEQTGSCIIALASSGRKDSEWLNELIKSSPPELVKQSYWFTTADEFLWHREKYGREDFRVGWDSESRYHEHKATKRAAELRKLLGSPDLSGPIDPTTR